MPFHAHKFGGSSVASAKRIHNVASLLQASSSPRIAVVSAMQGVTDRLTALANAALATKPWRHDWTTLREHQLHAARELHADDAVQAWLERELQALHALLSAPSPQPEWFAQVQGFGEVWSSRMLQVALGGEASGWARLDARDVLVVHPGELGVGIDWVSSRHNLAAWRKAHCQPNVVITGFIARDDNGAITTLGRNGSDYSSAIFAVPFSALSRIR